jgi:predicted dehydrogenase
MKNLPNPSRRRFLKTASMASAPLFMPGLALSGNTSTEGSQPLRFALVGCGGRGNSLALEASNYGKIVALCDVDEKRLANTVKTYPEATTFKDFRQVVEQDYVDAVLCATVDHWHVMVSIAAMKAGKDVYCEKPLTLTFEEGRHITKAVKETGRILQVGSQQRSEERFRRACECVRNGRIGKLRHVDVFIPEGPRMFPFRESQVPAGFDWDFWKGQTPDVPYVRERAHTTFRYWWDYSGGTLTDWGAHHNDIAIWGAGLEDTWPVKVKGVSHAPAIPDSFTADTRFTIDYEYAGGLTFTCQTTPDSHFYGMLLKKDGQGHGVKFIGDDGWIWVTRGAWEASDRAILQDAPAPGDIQLYKSPHHMENFVECTRTRKQPIVTAETGNRAAGTCHLGVIALRLGRPLKFVPKKELFIGDEEATSMLARPPPCSPVPCASPTTTASLGFKPPDKIWVHPESLCKRH